MSFLFSTISRSLLSRQSTQLFKVSEPLATFHNNLWFTNNTLRFKSGVKTHSGTKKRVTLRGGGSIKRHRSGRSHNTGYKARQRVNRLGSSTGVEGKKIEQRIRALLGCY